MFTKTAVLAGFAALAAAKPMAYPQQLDLAALIAQGPPAIATTATTAGVITVNPTSLASEAAASVTASPLPQTLVDAGLKKRQDGYSLQQAQVYTDTAGLPDLRAAITATSTSSAASTSSTTSSSVNACATRPAQPTGAGPVPSPDTASAFLADAAISSIAVNAPTPSGYVSAFTNLQAENSAYGYMGYTLLSSYDTAACAAQCNTITGCQAINVAFERSPSVDPGTGCDNPASTTLIKCVFWGSPVDSANANNAGQWRDNFQVVIAGSNGYTAIDPVGTQTAPGYTHDANLGDASINAPLDCNGQGSYMGYVSWNDGAPFSIARCAAACTSQTGYNVAHPPSDGSAPLQCAFFNTYFLLKDGNVQAQVCSMYTETWDQSFATNTGYYYGSDVYTIASSVTYTNATYPGVCAA